jgi:ABC-type uncharacterized transport system YnjBCD ATPase subunit
MTGSAIVTEPRRMLTDYSFCRFDEKLGTEFTREFFALQHNALIPSIA